MTNTSLVLCVPFTGRTHQLREHLRYLGHAIINDHDDEIDKEEEFSSEKMWTARYQAMLKHDCKEDAVNEEMLKFQLSFHDQYWNKQQFQICLHALRYESILDDFWAVETRLLPEWVNEKPSPLILQHIHYSCGLVEVDPNGATSKKISELVKKYSKLPQH